MNKSWYKFHYYIPIFTIFASIFLREGLWEINEHVYKFSLSSMFWYSSIRTILFCVAMVSVGYFLGVVSSNRYYNKVKENK